MKGNGSGEISSSMIRKSGSGKIAMNQPQVCSHQLLNAPPLMHNNALRSVADGSIEAMESFWSSLTPGITCFDIDVVTLKDGSFIASHPNRLSKALSRENNQKQQQQRRRRRSS